MKHASVIANENQLCVKVNNFRTEFPKDKKVGIAIVNVTVLKRYGNQQFDYRACDYMRFIDGVNQDAQSMQDAVDRAIADSVNEFMGIISAPVEEIPNVPPKKEGAPKEVKDSPREEEAPKKEPKKRARKGKKSETTAENTTPGVDSEILEEAIKAPETPEQIKNSLPPKDEEDDLLGDDEPAPQGVLYNRQDKKHKDMLSAVLTKHYPTWKNSPDLKEKIKKNLLPALDGKVNIFPRPNTTLIAPEFEKAVNDILG